jgi:hypothetical protein
MVMVYIRDMHSSDKVRTKPHQYKTRTNETIYSGVPPDCIQRKISLELTYKEGIAF